MSSLPALLRVSHPQGPARRAWRRYLQFFLLLSTLLGAALAYAVSGSPDFLGRLFANSKPPIVMLFGEVHDNAAQHVIQQKTVELLLESGARPVLLLEQINRERQAEIDHLLTTGRANAADIARIVQQGDGSQWNWDYYRPLLELALRYKLPVVAANISRADTRRIMSEGLAESGFDANVPADIFNSQARQMVDAHCGMIGESAGRTLATAQIARDQYMASLVERHAEQGVILIAGNGHVRRDIGVPRWLPSALSARAISIGLVEEGVTDQSSFDRTISTPPQDRPDPCLAMRDAVRPGKGKPSRRDVDA